MTSTVLDHTTRPTRPCAPRRAVRAQEPTPVPRLTRRGRFVVVVAVLLATFGAFTLRGAPAASTDVVYHPKTATVVVSPGETVWDIANRVAPHSDIRTTVAQIEELNSLSDPGAIRIGQPLSVPVG